MPRLFLVILAISSMFSGKAQDGLTHYTNGIKEYRAGNMEAAIAQFTAGIAVGDDQAASNYLGRAICYYYTRSMEKVEMDVQDGLKTESQNAAAVNANLYYTLGLLNNWVGEKQGAIDAFKKALTYNPDDTTVKTGYALTLLELDRPEEALPLLDAVLQSSPNDPFALNNRGLAYHELGKYEDAKRDLDASRKIDAANPFLFKNYYLLYKSTNDMQQACEALYLSLQLNIGYYGNPDDRQMWQEWWLADCGASKE